MNARRLLVAGAAVACLTAAAPPAVTPRPDRYGDPLPPGALMRLGTLRHREAGLCWESRDRLVADGATQLVGRRDKVVEVDHGSGRRRAAWALPKGYTAAGFTPDGRAALIHDGKSILGMYDFRGGKWIKKFEDRGQVSRDVRADFSPDTALVATSVAVNGIVGLIRVWDRERGELLWEVGKVGQHGGSMVVGFLPGGKQLALLDWFKDNRVDLIDVSTPQKAGVRLRSFPTVPTGESRSWQLSPDGKAVVIGTAGKAARVWDVASGKELPALGGHSEQARAFAFSRDGRLVATLSIDPFVLVREWSSGKLRRRIDLPPGTYADKVAFAAGGERLHIVLWGETAGRIYDLSTGREVEQYPEAHAGQVYGVVAGRDGQVVSGSQEGSLHVWNLATGRQVRKFGTGQTALGHRAFIHTMAGDDSGRLVATGQVNEGIVRLFDCDTGRPVRSITTDSQVRSVRLGGRGRLLVAADRVRAGRGGDPFLALYDATTGKELRRFADLTDGDCTISRDGEVVLGSSREGPRLWDASTGRRLRLLPPTPHSAAFAPDNRSLAAHAGRGSVQVLELASGQTRWEANPSADWSRCCCFSHDGRWLAVGRESDVDLYDALGGTRLHTFRGHESTVNALDFTRDGRRLVSGSSDTTLLVWDVAEALAKLPRPAARLDAGTLKTAWHDLAGDDARKAARALAALVDAPGDSVPWIRELLMPAPAPKAGHVERLLAMLDSDAFAEREQATRELERLGPDAEVALRRLLEGKPLPEVRRRAERLLARVENGGVSEPEHLRQLRALEVLERVGDKAALEVLRVLAGGAEEAWLTRQAKASGLRVRDYR